MMNDLTPPSPPLSLPVHVTRQHHSHSVGGMSPRENHTVSSVATLAAAATDSTNPQHHVRRMPTGQMADEAIPKERIDVINDFLQARVTTRPLIGVVCGSGLGGLSKCLSNQETIKYEDIPQFPRSTVEGHAGELVFGDLDGIHVVCMRGRFHCYEGYDMRETALPIRVMYLLGIKYLLVTNAAGGLNPDFNVGDLMIMNDHLNMPGLSGQHPLIGPNDSRFGARFTPLSNCYDKKLQDLAFTVAEKLGLAYKFRKGAYCFVSGPTYETPTECRFLRLVGGDAVGMSTVPEVIVAAHCGLKVLGMSLITNKALFPGEERDPASHNEVLETVQATQHDVERYVRDLIAAIGKQHNS
ncbi:Purine nucleoside phosphorylase I, inosine and guanosine-specific [Phytophthora megakarya]|uniref:purine-nucleoside phosphorylase n=1 Tax=Phytophthora megakarya TaxID=4795 RepID=A0A225VJE3_9STRA|nr:Purine nucleoside phosphorylase I, inosine and guanosine-specific [Phytophthora megakarya]